MRPSMLTGKGETREFYRDFHCLIPGQEEIIFVLMQCLYCQNEDAYGTPSVIACSSWLTTEWSLGNWTQKLKKDKQMLVLSASFHGVSLTHLCWVTELSLLRLLSHFPAWYWLAPFCHSGKIDCLSKQLVSELWIVYKCVACDQGIFTQTPSKSSWLWRTSYQAFSMTANRHVFDAANYLVNICKHEKAWMSTKVL